MNGMSDQEWLRWKSGPVRAVKQGQAAKKAAKGGCLSASVAMAGSLMAVLMLAGRWIA